jgi:hypothetical protein
MNLSNGNGDVLDSVSLSESKAMTPCTIGQKKKGTSKKKERKTPHIVL